MESFCGSSSRLTEATMPSRTMPNTFGEASPPRDARNRRPSERRQRYEERASRGRPRTGRSSRLNLPINPMLLADISRRATDEGVTRPELIERALSEYLERVSQRAPS